MPLFTPLQKGTVQRLAAGLTMLVLSLSLWGLYVFGREVQKEIDALAIANSDSLQWSLSQFEVEFLTMRRAWDFMQVDTADPAAEFLRRFDIFYSRVGTVLEARGFAEIVTEPGVREKASRIRTLVQETAARIDALPAPRDAAALKQALPDLQAQLEEASDDVRAIALEGVRSFAAAANTQRERVHTALLRLAGMTVALLTALTGGGFALWALWVYGQRRALSLRAAKLRLEAVIETALDAVIVVDDDMRVVEFNAAAEHIFGYTRAEAVGHDLAELIIPSRFVAAHMAALRRYRETGLRTIVGTGLKRLLARRKDGSQFAVELSISSTQIGRREIFVSYLRDITERVAAERELVTARDRAMAGERAKAAFVAVMSHELRTPLSGLLGTLENLRATRLTNKQQKYIEAMQQAGDLLLQHVNDVLDVERLDAGKMEMSRLPFAPEDLVAKLFVAMESEAAAKGNAFHLDADADLPARLLGDSTRIRQVLVNLVGNANKFTDHGRITVSISYDRAQGTLEYRVRDTGIGIATDDLPRIFDDFVSLRTEASGRHSGSGLGLGIARRIVEAMKGEIGVDSTLGEGSDFWVRLPAPIAPGGEALPEPETAMTGADPAPGPVSSAAPAGGLHILVAEDSDVNRDVLCEMLRRSGHRVVAVTDGAQAVVRAASERFDAVLMDINMPNKDGLTAASEIRAGESPNRDALMIAVSANIEPEMRLRAELAGFDGLLPKPFSKAALDGALQGVRTNADDPGTPDSAVLNATTRAELAEVLGPEQFAKSCAAYLTEGHAQISGLSHALRSGEMHLLASVAHRFAGSSAMMGADRLAAALRRLESLAREDQPAQTAQPMAEVVDLWRQTVKALVADGTLDAQQVGTVADL
jgi:PAS domain S-box-containing protein